jgi:hypothetical protein
MGTNAIADLKTEMLEGDGEPVPVIFVALDIHDAAQLRPFMNVVVEKFKLQRMISPPTTAHLLVTVVGDVTASAVKAAWQEVAAADQIATVFMSRMQVADVMRNGDPPEQVSLIGARA